jgi:hypothetical protein
VKTGEEVGELRGDWCVEIGLDSLFHKTLMFTPKNKKKKEKKEEAVQPGYAFEDAT